LICYAFERDNLHRELSRTQGRLTSRLHYDRLGRKDRREIFNDNRQRPAPASSSRQWFYDYQNNLTREEQNANPFENLRLHNPGDRINLNTIAR
jgi:hypothetical protein